MTRALLAAALLLPALACSKSGPAKPVATDRVDLPKSYKFVPKAVSVAPGTTVTWSNHDNFPHNVTLLGGTRESHDLPIGGTATVTFREAGTYAYRCALHPQQMRGTVVVG